MTKPSAVQVLALGAAVVTAALTGGAFWLSYEHLHDVADDNGLGGIRAWAWPGTVDLFIVAGELLILRAALRGRADWFAYLLAGVGSLGSIALNVAGVGEGAARMEYVVAAVPPVAALLAFAAIMRQVHERLAAPAEEPVPEAPDTPEYTPEYVPQPRPAAVAAPLPAPSTSFVGAFDKAPKSRPPFTEVAPLYPSPDLEGKGGSGGGVPGAEYSSRYVPEGAPEDGVHPGAGVPDEPLDELTEQARKEFADLLADGRTPSIRQLRDTYSIGQPRAQLIQRQFLA